MRGQRQELAKRSIAGPLAEPGRNNLIDDSKIERIAGNPDTCMRKRLRPKAASTIAFSQISTSTEHLADGCPFLN
jgi:hypothetical protein